MEWSTLTLKNTREVEWKLTHYNIEHTLWRYPSNYFIGCNKQAAVIGHYMSPHNPSLVPLTLEDLYQLE